MPPTTYLRLTSLIFFWAGSFAAAQQVPPVEPLPVQKPQTDAKVWGGLVFASAEKPAPSEFDQIPLPESFADLSKRLGKVFPYPHYTLLGQHRQDVFREYESWVVPTKDLFLKVDSKGRSENGGMNLHLQFWRDQQVIVKTDAVLKPSQPLFIAGPKWRGGQLLFVLVLE